MDAALILGLTAAVLGLVLVVLGTIAALVLAPAVRRRLADDASAERPGEGEAETGAEAEPETQTEKRDQHPEGDV